MDRQITIGRILFAIALLGFALQHLGSATVIPIPHVGPPWIAGFPIWSGTATAILLIAAIALLTSYKMRAAAGILGAGLLFYALALYLPGIIRNVRAPGGWTSIGELLCLAGVLLALSVPPGSGAARWHAPVRRAGWILYGAPLVIFAVQHFIYAEFVATLVPAWIPWHTFWTYAVGVGFIAAGLSIAIGPLRWWAGTILGVQFLTWVLVLHTPMVVAAPNGGNGWTSLFVALAMGGGAWVLAGTRPGRGEPAA